MRRASWPRLAFDWEHNGGPVSWTEAIIVFAVAFVVTFATVPLCKRIAKLIGAIDYPGNRRVNKGPVPRCGGIAMYFGLVAAAFTVFLGTRFFGWQLEELYTITDINYIVLYFGVTAMFAVGLVDDITQLKPWVKFVGQVVAATIVVLSGVSIVSVRMAVSGDYIELDWFDYPLSVLYLVVFVNITNLIDGLDGLASGLVAIVSAGLLYLVAIRGSMMLVLVCVAIIAVCLAFLRYNFYPASIFMGDSGSMLLGLVVGIVSIAGIARTQSFVIMLVPLAIAGVPVLDTISAIVRRLRGHQSIGEADMNHLHHRLMRKGLGQLRSVAVLWSCTAVLVVIGCLISNYSGYVRWAAFAVLFVAVFIVIWHFGLFKPVLRHHYDNRGRTGPRGPQERRKGKRG